MSLIRQTENPHLTTHKNVCNLILLIFIIVIISTIFIFIFFHPNTPKFLIDDVTLTQFAILPTDNNTLAYYNEILYYSLSINMTFRNPNPRIGMYYHKIEVNAIYQGKQFAFNNIDGGFYLGHKSENKNMSVVFKGEEFVALGSFEKSRYDLEKIDGVYEIELMLRVKIEYRHLVVKLGKYDECRVECGLKVPLSKVSPRRFERTKCRVR